MPASSTIPAANKPAIAYACTGAENASLISSGDIRAREDCLNVCTQGACCYPDIFNALGIYVIDDNGDHAKLESCLLGNEKICGDYTGCLTLSLSYSRPKTASPTITPPDKFVAEAPVEEIHRECSQNSDLITSGDEQAREACFNACRTGICCYADVFNAKGMMTVNDQGEKVPGERVAPCCLSS
jgi:hypothetical protein